MKKNIQEDQIQSSSENQLERQKKNLYKQKLNSFFHRPDKNDVYYTKQQQQLPQYGLSQQSSCVNFHPKNRDDSEDPRTRGSMLGESISKRRMKLKGLALPSNEANQRDELRKHSTPSSVYEHDNNLLTNPSERISYINNTANFINYEQMRFAQNETYEKSNSKQKGRYSSRNMGFLTNLEDCLDYFEDSKNNLVSEKDERLDSIITSNSVKFHTPHNDPMLDPYKGSDTINSTNGLINIDPSETSQQDQANIQILEQNYRLSDELNEVKSLVNVYSGEIERMKLNYSKLRGKYNIMKENNSLLMKKLEKERSSHNESRGFLKRQLHVKNSSNINDISNINLANNGNGSVLANGTGAVSKQNNNFMYNLAAKENYSQIQNKVTFTNATNIALIQNNKHKRTVSGGVILPNQRFSEKFMNIGVKHSEQNTPIKDDILSNSVKSDKEDSFEISDNKTPLVTAKNPRDHLTNEKKSYKVLFIKFLGKLKKIGSGYQWQESC